MRDTYHIRNLVERNPHYDISEEGTGDVPPPRINTEPSSSVEDVIEGVVGQASLNASEGISFDNPINIPQDDTKITVDKKPLDLWLHENK